MRAALFVCFAAVAWGQAPAQISPLPDPPVVARMRAALDGISQTIHDFGNTARYAAEDQKVPPPAAGEDRVVFMGDSITDFWGRGNNGSSFFPGKPYINRGISGQITPQMLLRFYPDVVLLHPKAVVILAGTNDIGGSMGPVPTDTTEGYLMAMADISRANNIKVVLASLLPVCDYHQPPDSRGPAQTQLRPPEKILALNDWMQAYAIKNNLVYLDYYSATVDDKGMFKAELTADGLHPNAAGYLVMEPLAEKALARALGK
jgi:lysophospholipase L1-like esterase